jgi:hypothetical protein
MLRPSSGHFSGISIHSLLAVTCLAALAFGKGAPLSAADHPKTLSRRLSRAETTLERGEYPAAGEVARQILAEGGAPDPVRARALNVLGKVLFFNSRVPFHGLEDTEELKRSRQEGLDLAARALRDAVALGGSSSNEARLSPVRPATSPARRGVGVRDAIQAP